MKLFVINSVLIVLFSIAVSHVANKPALATTPEIPNVAATWTHFVAGH